jgi:UDP-N-acetylglucosamine transferase subunit ALG13
MIFVTVGTDLPFDRMLRVIDRWAAQTERRDIFAQIGAGGWVPQAIPSAEFLEPDEFRRRFDQARIIIGHAGMGTILSALNRGKPILVMPKRASLGEQRNEHQLATARRMQALGKVHVAFDESELREMLARIDDLPPPLAIGSCASESLLRGIGEFIHARHPRPLVARLIAAIPRKP